MPNPFDISTDYKIWDNTETLDVMHRQGQPNIDFTTDTLQQGIYKYTAGYCLVRQMSRRIATVVRQIFQRGMSIANDKFDLVDTLIEIPIKEYPGPEISIDDTIIQYTDESISKTVKRTYGILAFDISDFGSRYRVACRSL